MYTKNDTDITVTHKSQITPNPRCFSACEQKEHTNPLCHCNTSKEGRAKLLENYLSQIGDLAPDPLIMPLDDEGKNPIITGKCRLESPQGESYLQHGDEAIRSIRENDVRGFALYAGNPSLGTERLVFTDHDDIDLFPLERVPNSLTVMSGSGRGYHRTYLNTGNVENAKGKGELEGAGEVRAKNWYVILPGSIHPSGGIYHIVQDEEIDELTEADLPKQLLPSSAQKSESTTPHRISSDEIQSLPNGFDPNKVENDVGVPLEEIRIASPKLDALLTQYCPSGYPSPSEADMATVSLLLYWRFDETDIANILRATRPRAKINRDEYVSTTIKNTALTEIHPCDSDLLKALINNAKRNQGRPEASSLTLMEVRETLLTLNGKATVREMAEFGLIGDDGIKEESLKRRIRRGLNILEDAGYVSSKRDGRAIVWESNGLEDFDLPDDYSLAPPVSTVRNQGF